MEQSHQDEVTVPASLRDVLLSLRRRISLRGALIAGAILAVAAGVVLNWSALVAAGLAPLILTLLPCAAMCAIGLCAKRLGGGGTCAGTTPDASNSRTDAEAAARPKEPSDA